jgi:hypothetical protein
MEEERFYSTKMRPDHPLATKRHKSLPTFVNAFKRRQFDHIHHPEGMGNIEGRMP